MIRLLKLIKPEYLDWYLAKDKSGMVCLYETKPKLHSDYWSDGKHTVILYDNFDDALINTFEDYDYKAEPIKVRELIEKIEMKGGEKNG